MADMCPTHPLAFGATPGGVLLRGSETPPRLSRLTLPTENHHREGYGGTLTGIDPG